MCIVKAGEIIRVTESTIHMAPKGKSMDAIYGDWIMKNDKVIAVIGDAFLGREANMRVQSIQGAVIDFTSLTENNDQLAAYYPHGIPGPDSRKDPALFADKIEIIKEKGENIQLLVSRKPSERMPYHCITKYILKDGENFLRVITSYYNDGKESVPINLADNLRLDMDISDASPVGKHSLAFMYNKWFGAAYGLYSAEGLLVPKEALTGHDPAVGLLIKYKDEKSNGDQVLKPGEKIEIERFLMYGKDVAEIQRNVSVLRGGPQYTKELVVKDSYNRSLEAVFIEVFNSRGELISFAVSDVDGKAQIPLNRDIYTFKASKVGHDTVSIKLDISEYDNIPIVMSPLTSITFSVNESASGKKIPVKLEFKGINGTPDPFLGTSKRAEGANNLYYAINNKGEQFEVPISPGDYLVFISHGPEFEVLTKLIEIKKGQNLSIEANLTRMFNSPKWIIADLHNHTTRSGDNDSDTKARIINMVAAGIEFAPATEHNRISSYEDEIKELGLESYLTSAAGIELTGPTGIKGGGPNHQNAFPLTIQKGKQGNGAPSISGDVYTQMSNLYNYDIGKTKVVQHNHPGYGMPRLYFDIDEDGVIDGGFNTRKFTDVIELQNFAFQILDVTTPNKLVPNHPAFYWLQMLNQGDRIFGTTTSDGHYVGATGERFVYIYSNDNAPNIDPYKIAENVKKGHVIMSNGPFMNATINNSIPGADIKRVGEGWVVDIEVFGNNQIVIDKVQLIINGKQDSRYKYTNESHPDLFRNEPMQFKHDFLLDIKQDAHVIIVASGYKAFSWADSSGNRKAVDPFVVSNPFFLDLEGDGFTANKDKLSDSLPKGRMAIE